MESSIGTEDEGLVARSGQPNNRVAMIIQIPVLGYAVRLHGSSMANVYNLTVHQAITGNDEGSRYNGFTLR